MSKREVGQLNGGNEIEGPRTKRRRETAGNSSDVDITHSDPVISGGDNVCEINGARNEEVKELGLKLWHTVKDAVNKEGRTLSLDFLRRPSKRLYPDYYQLIQRPIALDDIKKQLDNDGYPTLEAVRQEFELCFNNAKQYNIKESDIWRDAKDLLKLVNKTYSKLAPPNENGENVDGEGKSKSKAPNLNRLIKSRLQKLVDKTDDSGRVLSTEFMELPSKKDWPMYYKEIKRPQCLENIFKHIKRKEYHSSSEFAADVELVFANAMAFNQEHTGIWEDAKTLRDYFRVLVSDLPPPFALPEYAVKPKIKIKPQAAQQSTFPAAQPSTSPSQTLRIPAATQAKASPTPIPISPAAALPGTTTTPPASTLALSATQSAQLPPMGAPQPISYMNTTLSHYPNASYIPPVPTPPAPTVPTSTANLPAVPAVQLQSSSSSPAPPLHLGHQLKSVSLTIEPHGRILNLDYQYGVKCWAMRLVPGETEVHVSRVTFMNDEEEESSGGEEEEELELKQEEEEEDMETDAPMKNGRKRGKVKGRGRPKAISKTVGKAKAMTLKKKKQKIGPIHVKLDESIVQEQEDETGKWRISPAVGSSVLEVGESGGLIWKVYIQRLAG